MDAERLVELETEVWEALVRGDAAADESLLSRDFLGVYPTGFAGRTDHVEQLAGGPTVATYHLSDIRTVPLGDTCALIAYRAVYVRVGDGAMPESMYVSSVWERRGDTWSNVFSQDTPATGERVV